MKKEPIIVALVALTPFAASAYFKYIPAPQEIPEPVAAPTETSVATPVPLADDEKCDECDIQKTSVRSYGVRALGAPYSPPKALKVGGIDRFSVAVEKIAPSGWVVENRMKGGMDNRVVEWSAGRPWPQTLESIALAADRSVLVDWNAQAIIIE